jgi:hypothetical protein
MVYPGSLFLLTHLIKVGEDGLDVRCVANIYPTQQAGRGTANRS